MHEPTPPARREAALRYQAEQLLRDAAAWGYDVEILAAGRRTGGEQAVNLRPLEVPGVLLGRFGGGRYGGSLAPQRVYPCHGPQGGCPHVGHEGALPERCRACGSRETIPF